MVFTITVVLEAMVSSVVFFCNNCIFIAIPNYFNCFQLLGIYEHLDQNHILVSFDICHFDSAIFKL